MHKVPEASKRLLRRPLLGRTRPMNPGEKRDMAFTYGLSAGRQRRSGGDKPDGPDGRRSRRGPATSSP